MLILRVLRHATAANSEPFASVSDVGSIKPMSDMRDKYLEAKRGDFIRYAGMIGEEFAAKIDRLSQIIGTSHELSRQGFETRTRSWSRDRIVTRHSGLLT